MMLLELGVEIGTATTNVRLHHQPVFKSLRLFRLFLLFRGCANRHYSSWNSLVGVVVSCCASLGCSIVLSDEFEAGRGGT